jgi:dTDP-4-amino-4,6-dideoxygalactose transaminase
MSDPQIKIPMLDLAAQHATLEEELLEGFSAVISSGRFILGDPVEAFEKDLATLCEAQFAVACHSGTDALWLALTGLGIGVGDAVLCPAYSFFSTAATIARIGATPVFCDIDSATLNLDPYDAIRRAEATPNLRAVISVDLFGRACERAPLAHYCNERGVPIIQDAAQSLGAVDESGHPVGSQSVVTCFSFYPTKNLGALGDAGGIVTADPELRDRMASLRVHGETEPGIYSALGINSRLDALQAVALSVKLRHLGDWSRARHDLARHYDALFATHGAIPSDQAFGSGSISLQTPVPVNPPGEHAYHRYVIRVPAEVRSGLMTTLSREGIASEIYYPRGLHEQPALAEFKPLDPLIETERASRESLALPLYPELGFERVERVVNAVVRALHSG